MNLFWVKRTEYLVNPKLTKHLYIYFKISCFAKDVVLLYFFSISEVPVGSHIETEAALTFQKLFRSIYFLFLKAAYY